MTKKTYESLAIPPGARRNGGLEVLRAGIAEQNLTMSIRRAFDDPVAWGALLATAGRQVATIYARETGLDEAEARARILMRFQAEMNSAEDAGTITAAS